MRLRQIEVFHAIYTTGSITNAATMLNVSQPSVSKVLAHAEQQLGYRLFDRVKGKLVPTPEAHQLFVHVKAVYMDVDRLRHVATNIKAASAGRIRVAGTPAFGLEVLPRAVASFQQQHPGTVFEIETLHCDEISDALHESRIDIGLAFNPTERPGIGQQQLANGRFVVLAPEQETFGGKTELTVGDLVDFPFIALNSRGPLGQALSNYFAEHGAEFNVVAWSETYHVARELVAQGIGVTIADDVTARSGATANVRRIRLRPTLRFKIKALHLDAMPLSIGAKRFTKHFGVVLKQFLADD
jgi:DNA-binding transcriptional LysR family regulator